MIDTSIVIWHDLECGGYAEDLPLWRSLAAQRGGPVLEVGAGTGRVSLELARAGHAVIALDREQVLLRELASRAGASSVCTVLADACDFDLRFRVPLCLVPMQTIQLLGGPRRRAQFLRTVSAHLEREGLVAVSITEILEPYEVIDGGPFPLPDICEIGGVVYSSQPTAVRVDQGYFELERRRETVGVDGERTVERDTIRMDRVGPAQLEREAAGVGLKAAGRAVIASTRDYAGSTVVMLSA